MTFYLMLRGEGDTTTDHDYQDYFRCYPGDQNKELLFLSWDVTKKKYHILRFLSVHKFQTGVL